MKVILSRKGFDSSNGGLPSLIMPNGDVVSMPIPSDDRVKYSNLQYGGKTYWQILKELRPGFAPRRCHLDPDLDAARCAVRVKRWNPAFGQRGPAASYLMNTVGVEPGDLFLFFGNFRAVEEKDGRYRFVNRTGDFYRDKPVQLIWGYLQVGEIITDGARIRRDYPWHPHADRCRSNDPTNGKGACVQQDDMQKVYPIITDAEMIVFASPVYYFTMSAQIQAAIQRFYVWGQHPTMKKGCLLLSSYSPDVYDGAVGEYRGILRYFGAADCGIVTSDNTTNKTEAKLSECYELGKSVK